MQGEIWNWYVTTISGAPKAPKLQFALKMDQESLQSGVIDKEWVYIALTSVQCNQCNEHSVMRIY